MFFKAHFEKAKKKMKKNQLIVHCGKIYSQIKFEGEVDKQLLKTLKKAFEIQLNNKYIKNRYHLIKRWKLTGKSNNFLLVIIFQ